MQKQVGDVQQKLRQHDCTRAEFSTHVKLRVRTIPGQDHSTRRVEKELRQPTIVSLQTV